MNRHYRDSLLFLGLFVAIFGIHNNLKPNQPLYWIVPFALIIFGISAIIEYIKGYKYDRDFWNKFK